MGRKIQFRRGTYANLPSLDDGEPGWVTDRNQLYVGQGGSSYLIGNNIANIKSFGAVGDGITSDTTAIDAAIDNSEGFVFFPPGTWVIDENKDWSANTDVTFFFSPGAVLSHGAYTVNIPDLEAGAYEIFTGTGAVTFGDRIREVYPEWWGIDGTADDVEINIAIVAALETCPVKLSGKTYNTTGPIVLKDGTILTGSGMRNTIINYTGAGEAIHGDASATSLIGMAISNFTIDANGAKGILLTGGAASVVSWSVFSNLYITDVSYGIQIENTGFSTVYKNLFQNIIIYDVDNYGIYNYEGPYNYWQQIEVTGVNNGAYAIRCGGINNTLSGISVDGCLRDDGGDNTWTNIQIETINAAVLPEIYAFRITNGNCVINGLFLNNIDPAKCDYGIYITLTGNVINHLRFYGTNYPTYPVLLATGSSGTLIQCYKGGVLAQDVDYYSTASLLAEWEIIGGDIGGTQKLIFTNPFIAITDADATPSVKGASNLSTANTGATTITMFDDGMNGQSIKVVFGDSLTTIDFSGTSLKGNAGADWTPTAGDWMECVFDGTNWYCSVHDCTA